MKWLLVCLALFVQSTSANGQTSTSEDEGCVNVSDAVSVCLKDSGQTTWAVVGSGGQIAFLPDPRVRVEVETMPFDPEWGLSSDKGIVTDQISVRIAEGIPLKEGETLRAFGNQGSFQKWGDVGTQKTQVSTMEFEINSADDECTKWVTYRRIGDDAMLLISSHYCSASGKTYSEVEHYELLNSIWLRREQ